MIVGSYFYLIIFIVLHFKIEKTLLKIKITIDERYLIFDV